MKKLFVLVKQKITDEPVMVTAAVADVLLFLADQFNVVVNDVSVKTYVAPLLVGFVQRAFVTPTKKVVLATDKPVVKPVVEG